MRAYKIVQLILAVSLFLAQMHSANADGTPASGAVDSTAPNPDTASPAPETKNDGPGSTASESTSPMPDKEAVPSNAESESGKIDPCSIGGAQNPNCGQDSK